MPAKPTDRRTLNNELVGQMSDIQSSIKDVAQITSALNVSHTNLAQVLTTHMTHDESIDIKHGKILDDIIHRLEQLGARQETLRNEYHNGDSGADHQQDHRDFRKHIIASEDRQKKQSDELIRAKYAFIQKALWIFLGLACVGLTTMVINKQLLAGETHVELAKVQSIVIEQSKQIEDLRAKLK